MEVTVSALLSADNVETLQDNSPFQIIVKRNILSELHDGLLADAEILLCAKRLFSSNHDTSDRNALASLWTRAGMGNVQNKWTNSAFRGDDICWLTPALCKIHSLKSILALAKTLITELRCLKSSLKLNLDDVSVQFAEYVSPKCEKSDGMILC